MKVKPVINIILNVTLIIALASKAKTWFAVRMWTNPDATCAVCGKNHSLDNEGASPQSFPIADEIINASVPYWRDGDLCGFQSYVASLYRGDGTNYLPAIALSGWNDRAMLADLESASKKYSRLQAFHTLTIKKNPESHKQFYNGRNGLAAQIWELNSDIHKDGKMSLRLASSGGYRAMIREESHRFSQHKFDELHDFIRNAPSIFITNAILPAASAQDANPISRIRRKENLDAVIKSNGKTNVLLCVICVAALGFKTSQNFMARKNGKCETKPESNIWNILIILSLAVIVAVQLAQCMRVCAPTNRAPVSFPSQNKTTTK